MEVEHSFCAFHVGTGPDLSHFVGGMHKANLGMHCEVVKLVVLVL